MGHATFKMPGVDYKNKFWPKRFRVIFLDIRNGQILIQKTTGKN
jgi:hypothetical protein